MSVDIQASKNGEMKGVERNDANVVRVKCLGAKHSFSSLKPMTLERRTPLKSDVVVQVMFCGICCTDVHFAKNEEGETIFPCVPGHEVVGRVTQLGLEARKFNVGDLVAVGPIIDCCGACDACQAELDQCCKRGFTMTYNGNIRNPLDDKDGVTRGGYSQSIVIDERHVLRVPAGLDAASAAPIVCVGITVYSPLAHWNIGKGSKLAVVGYGGLGHFAVKLAVARGAEVSVISSNADDKSGDALRNGAVRVVDETDKQAMASVRDCFDFVLSTISVPHDPMPYVELLRREGTLIIVGSTGKLKGTLDVGKMLFDRRSIAASVCGSTKETQELLDFCAQHQITPDIKIISAADVNDAFAIVHKGEAGHRFVIDMSTLQ